MPEPSRLYALADLYKVFGDFTRVRILFALLEGEACVCELSRSLEMTVSAISHQLKILKQSKLVRCRRDGKSMLYSLADGHVSTMLAQGLAHVEE